MTKPELRKSFLEQRKALSNEAYEKKNRDICSIFFDNIRLNNVRVLHTFIPMADRREPDTLQIITHLQNNFPLIQIAVPRVTPGTNKLESFYIEKTAVFQKSKWGIDEPSHGQIVDPVLIDMVIVPLLVFDYNGHRVGYGKGFYDRFLSSCRDNCIKIGLSLFPPVKDVQAEVHDVRLNLAITPDNIYTF